MAETDEEVIDRAARYLEEIQRGYADSGIPEATIALHKSTWLAGFCAGVMPSVSGRVVEYLLDHAAGIVAPHGGVPLR